MESMPCEYIPVAMGLSVCQFPKASTTLYYPDSTVSQIIMFSTQLCKNIQRWPDWKAHGSKICQTENQMHHEMICFEPHHEPASPVSWASHTSQKHDCCQPPRVGRPLPQLERKGWRCTHSCVAVQCEALNPFGIGKLRVTLLASKVVLAAILAYEK